MHANAMHTNAMHQMFPKIYKSFVNQKCISGSTNRFLKLFKQTIIVPITRCQKHINLLEIQSEKLRAVR